MKALEPVHVKGKEAPVQAYRVLGARAVQSEEVVLGAMSLTPFVGRGRQMAIFEELLGRGESGEVRFSVSRPRPAGQIRKSRAPLRAPLSALEPAYSLVRRKLPFLQRALPPPNRPLNR